MRNVAFSLMLVALALLQIAVISTELSQSNVQTSTVAKRDARTHQVLASTETLSKTSYR
jgi:hypothetical protein